MLFSGVKINENFIKPNKDIGKTRRQIHTVKMKWLASFIFYIYKNTYTTVEVIHILRLMLQMLIKRIVGKKHPFSGVSYLSFCVPP